MQKPLTLYGIPKCDSVKKARRWLEEKKIPYHFHDFKKAALDSTTIQSWLQQTDWPTLINKKGTTWRKLDPVVQNQVSDTASAIRLMLAHPSVIKRPVLVTAEQLLIGFDVDLYTEKLAR